MAWTTTELLADIRSKAYISDTHPEYTSAVLLRYADEEHRTGILPALLRIREEYNVTHSDQSITAARQSYRIPSRAQLGLVRKVFLLDTSGNAKEPPYLAPETLELYSGQTAALSGIGGYTVSGDEVYLLPTPANTEGTLRIKYYRRPSKLVAPSTAADELPHVITAGVTTTTLTLGAAHGFDDGDLVDVVQANPPFSVLAQSIAVSSVTGTTVNIPAVITDLAVGDYLATAEETPVPLLPAELHSVLAQAVAVRVLKESGSLARHSLASAQYDRDLGSCLSAMTPRQRGSATKVFNPYSPLRSRMSGY
jgi:hypothetical protein